MNRRLTLGQIPWIFLAVAAATLVVQVGGWRGELLYDRGAVASGQWWRLWTGHLVHFGWPHFVADAGLFVILGWLIEPKQPVLARLSLGWMTAGISLALFFFDPGLERYGGLSAYNLGLLLFYAGQGWRKNWTDWFWPAVLVIYAGELILEAVVGHGQGGGMIQFDDPGVHVATTAHLAGTAGGLILLAVDRRRPPDSRGIGKRG
ncbi:MAG: rhombosortase [Opitutae bacterium]|nr:rhombosortase [Opitutae bacterium]